MSFTFPATSGVQDWMNVFRQPVLSRASKSSKQRGESDSILRLRTKTLWVSEGQRPQSGISELVPLPTSSNLRHSYSSICGFTNVYKDLQFMILLPTSANTMNMGLSNWNHPPFWRKIHIFQLAIASQGTATDSSYVPGATGSNTERRV